VKLTLRKGFVLLLFIGLFIMTLRPVADPDFWWHLRTGELIAQTGAIPHSDPFSFTRVGTAWVAHEWLAELMFYGLYRLGGFGLLILLFSLLITATFFFVYKSTPRTSRPYIAGFVLLLGALACAPTWGVRPQMISFFLTSLLLFLLERFQREKKVAYLVPLPFMALVWVNLHAGYFLALAIVGISIAGGIIEFAIADYFKSLFPNPPSLKSVLQLCGALGISVLATLVNPNGFHILIYPFQTLTSPSMQQFIQEWFSPDFHQLAWQPLAILILALTGAAALAKKPISLSRLFLLMALGYAALHSMRNVPLFILVAVPFLAEQIDELVKIPAETHFPRRLIRVGIGGLLLLALLTGTLRFVQVGQQEQETIAQNFPEAAVNWIEENHPSGNLFNSYGWGGYIIWRLYPENPVYIDGRADVYGDQFIFDYMSTYHGQPGWDSVLASRDVRIVLVEPLSGIANVLRSSDAWSIAYEDRQSILFIKK
jgi:hypothetical protein